MRITWETIDKPYLENKNKYKTIPCNKCGTSGHIDIGGVVSSCDKCGGSGMVDWIENIRNKNYYKGFSEDLINELSKNLRDEIDREILKGIKNGK